MKKDKQKDFVRLQVMDKKNTDKGPSKQWGETQPSECALDLKSVPVQVLRNQLQQQKIMLEQKQQELANSDKMHRLQSFKNKTYKARVAQAEKQCEALRIQLTRRLIHQFKGNKETPLFFNQLGMSPYQLTLLNYSKNTSSFESNICMTCFCDIELNSQIVILPCQHVLHRQCGTQHLLYSKECPCCNTEVYLEDTAFEEIEMN